MFIRRYYMNEITVIETESKEEIDISIWEPGDNFGIYQLGNKE